jgi:dipeptidyl aminopeptidase/acylaminoacyl peptidase
MKIAGKYFWGIIVLGALCATAFILDQRFQIVTVLFSEQNLSPREELSNRIPTAVLLWSHNGTVKASGLKRWKPVSITQGENPRWSPDGQKFVFTKENDVWLMRNDLAPPVKIIDDVVTEYGTGGYWSETGDGIFAIRRQDPRQVIKLELASGKESLIHDEGQSPYEGYHLSQCAESRFQGRYLLTFTIDDGHRTTIVDLENKKYINNKLMRDGDCGPAWSPDGRFIVATRRGHYLTGRPIYRAEFDEATGGLSPSRYLIGEGRCGNAAISNDSAYVTYASAGNIYCWKVDQTAEKPRHGVQLTFDGHNDQPSLFIYPENIPSAFH